ncbi:Phosphodiesterase/alkaline phosphatase D [Orpheovirus IHUMI-LCC2]|uniref:Phosphodiesterase/alkaline phosphatase D n=1 Tax=Orpheovirus IHUMI-LCC2 TaxID=2023057 RepID=A0A2I2L3W3_9VIRU|nr:Phosphodiesterase/alkaline phosphatase D [Orpheovirus IHUMI-LCC2]SNW62245.1 Phosphodiesterase/alkaline phosphatase D [Orpheovirus IHUMI-LCC2]
MNLNPIVGEVTHNQAKILFVPSSSTPLTLYINDIKNQEIQPIENVVNTLVLKGLSKDNTYTIKFYQDALINSTSPEIKPLAYCTFKTFSIPKHIHIVSCDLLEIRDAGLSAWNKLSSDMNIELMLHIGDNVYMDREHYRAINYIEDKKEINMKVIEDDMRKRYHRTWNGVNNVLARTSNMMIWDDHDVHDGFHIISNNVSNPNKVEEIAIKLYKEYQEGLLINPPAKPGGSWYRQYGDLLLFVCERTTLPEGNVTEELLNSLSTMLYNPYVKRLALVFTSAPIPVPTGVLGKAYSMIYGTDGLWKDEELTKVYDVVYNWLDGSNFDSVQRNAVIIGGDLHIGVDAVITRGGISIPLFISSSVSNYATIAERLFGMGMVKRTVGNYKVEYNNVVYGNNYVVLKLEDNKLDAELLHVKDSLIPPNYLLSALSSLKGIMVGSSDDGN